MKKKLILIGAGVSGLSTLYFILKKKAQHFSDIEIYEKKSQIGGVLTATKEDGFLLEHGAQGVLATREKFISLISELGLESEVVAAPAESSQRAFFFKK